MNNGIARRVEITTIDEASSLAEIAVKSRLYNVPSAEAALMILLTGQDLGLSASQSLRAIYVVSGKPVISADALVAAVRRSGQCESWRVVESTTTVCTITTLRKGESEYETESFTIEDAKRARLDGKDVWKAYPRDMLRHRCAAALARRVYPDLVLGVYAPGELPDDSPIAVTVETTEPKRAKLSDEEKSARVNAILRDYDAAIESGTAPDVAHEDAKRAGRDAGVATLVQAELTRRASAEAEAKREANLLYEMHAADVIDALNAALVSAGDVPAAIAGAWVDHSEAVLSLRQEDAQKAKLQVENAWKAAGGARGGLSAAAKAERERRAQSASEVQS